jgi:hypothetical protein
MGTESKPTSIVEKENYFNKMDEAYGFPCLLISLDLIFHIEPTSTQNEVWTTLNGLFGKHDEL